MSQSICIISSHAPYAGQTAREALDVALVSASYDLHTSLLLMGEGVYQVLDQQNPGELPRKNLSALFKALPMYGIDTIYVDADSLDERHLTAGQLLPEVTLLEEGALAPFIARHDKVLNF